MPTQMVTVLKRDAENVFAKIKEMFPQWAFELLPHGLGKALHIVIPPSGINTADIEKVQNALSIIPPGPQAPVAAGIPAVTGGLVTSGPVGEPGTSPGKINEPDLVVNSDVQPKLTAAE